MILKSIAAAATLLAVSPVNVLAADSGTRSPNLAPSATISRGEATNIRNCPLGGEYDRAVCYNQVREGSISLLGVPVLPITWSSNRAYVVDCLRTVRYSEKTVAGRVANEFCPVVSELPTAPFLR